jgi:trans-2,3-dihydro-3-hydroxyanthranilate isomerase
VDIIDTDELTMEQKQPTFGKIIQHSVQIAEMLQIEEEDLENQYPIQVVSTGLPSVIVFLKTLDAVKRCSIHHDRFQQFIDHSVKASLLVFSPEAENKDNDLRV